MRNSFHNPQQIGHMFILLNREEKVSEGGERAAVLLEEVTTALRGLRLGDSAVCRLTAAVTKWNIPDGNINIFNPSILPLKLSTLGSLQPWIIHVFVEIDFCSPSCRCWHFNPVMFVLCYCRLISRLRPVMWFLLLDCLVSDMLEKRYCGRAPCLPGATW